MIKVRQFLEQKRGLIDRMDNSLRAVMVWVKQFLEQTGIYIFFISLILATQIRWLKKHNNYDEIEIRLSLGFLAGIFLSLGVIKLIKEISSRFNKDHVSFLANLSIALSPGILFILGSTNKGFRVAAIILCVLFASYIWIKPFRDFVNSIIYIEKFKGVLIIQDGSAVIDMKGTYERANPKAMQFFLNDLIINFYECSEQKIEEIKIDFSNLKEKAEYELKPVIESIARYFNLRIVY